MDHVFIPEYNTGNCAYIRDADVIRVYDSQPRQNATISYKDYYIKSSYIYNTGSTTFSNYSTLPTCISDSRISTEYYYRNDFPLIVLTGLAIIVFCYYFCRLCVRTVFLGWRWS